jgi:hypothetical protein
MSASDAIGTERLEALLAGDAPRTSDETRRADLLAQLRSTTLSAPETLRERVRTAAPSRNRSFGWRPPRRLVLAAIPAACALAVTAAIVHGLTTGPAAHPVAQHAAVTQTFGSKALKRLSPQVGAGSSAQGTPAPAIASPQATLAPTGDTNRLQQTDASLQVRVPDIEHLSSATRAATRIATSLGGYAQSVDYKTPHGSNGTAAIELRVPAQNVQKALARLAGLGTLVSQQVSVKDLQHALQVQSEQVAQLRRRIAALHTALADPALPDAQRVLLQIKLSESKRALAQRLNARKGTVTAGTTARISLVLSTEKSIVTPTPHRGHTSRMLHSAIDFLGVEAVVVLYALIVISPFAVLGGLAWALFRVRRRREEQRLLVA